MGGDAKRAHRNGSLGAVPPPGALGVGGGEEEEEEEGSPKAEGSQGVGGGVLCNAPTWGESRPAQPSPASPFPTARTRGVPIPQLTHPNPSADPPQSPPPLPPRNEALRKLKAFLPLWWFFLFPFTDIYIYIFIFIYIKKKTRG